MRHWWRNLKPACSGKEVGRWDSTCTVKFHLCKVFIVSKSNKVGSILRLGFWHYSRVKIQLLNFAWCWICLWSSSWEKSYSEKCLKKKLRMVLGLTQQRHGMRQGQGWWEKLVKGRCCRFSCHLQCQQTTLEHQFSHVPLQFFSRKHRFNPDTISTSEQAVPAVSKTNDLWWADSASPPWACVNCCQSSCSCTPHCLAHCCPFPSAQDCSSGILDLFSIRKSFAANMYLTHALTSPCRLASETLRIQSQISGVIVVTDSSGPGCSTSEAAPYVCPGKAVEVVPSAWASASWHWVNSTLAIAAI